jgi:hypothetical protein
MGRLMPLHTSDHPRRVLGRKPATTRTSLCSCSAIVWEKKQQGGSAATNPDASKTHLQERPALGAPKRIPGSSPQKKSRVRGSWGSVARRPERRSQRVIVGDPTRHPVSAAPSPCEHWPVPQHTPSPIPSPTVFSSHIQFLLLFVSMTSSSCPAPLPKPKAGQGLVPLCGVALLANVIGAAGFRFRFRFR